MAQVVAAQGVFDGGLQKSQLIAGVITGARKGIGIDPFAVGHEAQGIGELNFAAFSGLDAAQDFKDIRRQDIAAEGAKRLGASSTDGFSIMSMSRTMPSYFVGMPWTMP